MKNLQKLGKILNKNEQKEINGGRLQCDSIYACPSGQCCKSSAGYGGHPSSGYCGIPNQGPDLCFPIGPEYNFDLI